MPENIPLDNVLTELQGGFAQMHEVYLAAVQAGFTESQAMQIILEILRFQAGKS